MRTDELERAAYAAGDTDRAQLLARIDELTRALGEAVAEVENLTEERDALADQLHDIREGQQ
jgi:uncharacterized membrane protein